MPLAQRLGACFKDVSRDLSVVAAEKAGDIAFSGWEGAAACLSIIFLMAIVSPLSSDDGAEAARTDIDNIFGGKGRGMQRGKVRATSAYSSNNVCFV